MNSLQRRGAGVPYKAPLTKTSNSGQAMIEFALILVVMMGLFIGAFELMTLYRKRTDLATASRMGARQASELWITTTSDADFEQQVRDYVLGEMVLMGYSQDWIDGTNNIDPSDDKVRVVVNAYEYDPLPDELVASGSKMCTYGQYIQVDLEMDWTFAVLPINTLIGGGAPETGTMYEESIVRCWRGN